MALALLLGSLLGAPVVEDLRPEVLDADPSIQNDQAADLQTMGDRKEPGDLQDRIAASAVRFEASPSGIWQAHTQGGLVEVHPDRLVAHGPEGAHAIGLPGARLLDGEGLRPLSSRSHHFGPGLALQDVPHFAALRFTDAWPGTDLVLYGTPEGHLEFDHVAARGADASVLRLRLAGAHIQDGELHAGPLRLQAPVAYQETPDGQVPVAVSFTPRPDGTIGYDLGAHDPSLPLVIDPILRYASYLGGGGPDTANAVAVHPHADPDKRIVYVAGQTSTGPVPVNFTGTGGSTGSGTTAFLARHVYDIKNHQMTGEWFAYFGGSGTDRATGVAVDASGSIFVGGTTNSADFPVVNPVQGDATTVPPNYDGGVHGGGHDGFIVRFTPTGSLDWGTYIGGLGPDTISDLALDAAGRVAVVGSTETASINMGAPGFPVHNAFQTAPSSPYHDATVTMIDSSTSEFVFSTFLGHGYMDYGSGIAIDKDGIYVTGTVFESFLFPAPPFPTTLGAFQERGNGFSKWGFITKFNLTDPTRIDFSTLLGGPNSDLGSNGGAGGQQVQPMPDGSVWAYGHTGSEEFPACGNPGWTPPTCTGGTFSNTFAGAGVNDHDVTITLLDRDGSSLEWSSYFGNALRDSATGLVLDHAHGDVVFVGQTYGGAPTSSGALPALGNDELFLHRFNRTQIQASPTGTLGYATMFGGSADDGARDVAVDDVGNLYIVGTTSSTDLPTQDPLQWTNAGGSDSLVLVLAKTPPQAVLQAMPPVGIPTTSSTSSSPLPRLEVISGDQVAVDMGLSTPGDRALGPSRSIWTLYAADGTTELDSGIGGATAPFSPITASPLEERVVCVEVRDDGPLFAPDGGDEACLRIVWTNRDPIAVNDTFVVLEDSGLNELLVLDNDSDPDGEPLEIVAITILPAGAGMVTHNGTQLNFTPAPDFYSLPIHSGSPPNITLEYTLQDPAGATATGSVTIAVQNVNDPPVARDDTYTVEPGSTTDLMVLGNDDDAVDPPGEVLVNAIDQPSTGQTMLPSTNDRVAYTAHSLVVGTTSFNYTLIDEDGATDTATVTVQVEPAGGVLAYDDTFSVQEDEETNLDVMANDVGPDRSPPAVLDSISDPANGEARRSDDGLRIVYMPDEDHFGSDTFTYTLTRNGATSTATVNLTVLPVNDPPRARDDEFDLVEDSTGNVLAVLDNDDSGPDDPEVLEVVDMESASSGTTQLKDGDVLYTPDPDFFGEDSFTYTIEDPDGAQATATVTLTVNNTPDAPVAVDDDFQVSAGLPGQELAVLANDVDVDGDTLTITEYEWDDTYGGLTNEGDVLKVSPGKTFLGEVVLRYRMTDGLTESDWATVTLDIVAPKEPLLVLRERTSPLCAGVPIHVRGIALQYDHTATKWNWSANGHSEVFDHTGDIHDWTFTADDGEVGLTLDVRFEDDQGGAHWAAETWPLQVIKCVPPVADFGFTTDGLRARFEDRSSDPDGSLKAWHWDFDDEGTSSEASPSHTYAQGGHYLVRLTVTDDDGNTHSIERVVAVSGSGGGSSSGSGGSGDAGGSGGTGGSGGSGGVSGSTDDSGVTNGSDGSAGSEDAGPGGTGSEGATGSDGSSSAQQEDRPPVVVASASDSAAPGDLVELDGSDSHDPNGDALTYRWIQTGGETVDLEDATSAKAAFVAPMEAAELRFRLEVKAGAASDATELTVRVVASTPPKADFEAEVGDGVRLRDTSQHADDATYTWTVGGQTQEGKEVTLDLAPGDHEVHLVVENAFGRSEAKQTVHVPEPGAVVNDEDPDPLAVQERPDQTASMALWGWGIVGLLAAAVVVAMYWLLRRS